MERCQWNYQGYQAGKDGVMRNVFSPATDVRNAYQFFDDFCPSLIESTTACAGYDVTALVAGTLVMQDTAGGWLGLVGGADGQGIQLQADGAMFTPTADKDIFFECSLKIEDADDADWMIGLAVTDTNIFSTDPTELIVFRGADSSANIDFQVRNASTGASADTGVDAADGTAVRLGFWVRGVTSVIPYINGTAYTAVTANIPSGDALRVTYGMQNGATSANQTVAIDWIKVTQAR
ncbi:MAG TPA: hypothetical protein VM238_05465 [Phycisphaerae bacterium]|nr:hypothetical protein [Phycisphaerae bacterium]